MFDSFGTLFDVHSVAALAERLAPGNGAALSRIWSRRVRAGSCRTAARLEPLVRSTGLADVLDGILSADDAGLYKPSPRVDQLAVDQLGLASSQIAFVSSTGWDAAGAKAFGFATYLDQPGRPSDRRPCACARFCD